MLSLTRTTAIGSVLMFLMGCGGGDSATPDTGPADVAGAPREENVAPVSNSMTDSPPEPVSSANAPATDAAPATGAANAPSLPTPDATTTAAGFSALAKNDRDAWNKQFQNKVVQMTGTVAGYTSGTPGLSGTGLELLLANDDTSENPFNVIKVGIAEDRPWLKYAPGSTVTVIGKTSFETDKLEDAVVTSTQPGPDLPRYTAEELSAADPDAINQAELFRMLYLRGTFRRFDEDFDQTGLFYLGSGDDDLVMVRASGYEKRRVRHLKPGDAVLTLGSGSRRADELPLVVGGFLVEPLPQLPELPAQQMRANEYGKELVHLLFTADTLGEWMTKDPRALQIHIKQATAGESFGSRRLSYDRIEVSGGFESVEPIEMNDQDVFLRLKSEWPADVRFLLKKGDAILNQLKPGTSVTIRGKFNWDNVADYAYVDQCQVSLN